jgi:2-dehydropantoate 2-reductase
MSRIVIWGAGAIGGVLGAWMARAGLDVLLVDRDAAHVRAVNERGLAISGTRGPFEVRVPAALPEDVEGPLDTVVLAVKCQATADAVEQIRPLLAPEGVVVSAQNGLNEEVIADRIGTERTIGCFVNFSADWQGPGHVEHGGEHPIYVGELDGRETERVRGVADVFGRFCETIVTGNIWGYLWSKLCYASLLFATATVDAPVYEILRRPGVGPTMHALVAEAITVPERLGLRLEDLHGFRPDAYRGDGWEASMEAIASFYEGQIKVKTGVWRDLAVRHRPTEVDCQVGTLVAKGAGVGLPMPLNRRLVEVMHDLEAGRRTMGWANLEELSAAAADAEARS